MGGRWRTDDPQVNEEIKRIENERNPKIKRPRGRPPKVKSDTEVKIPKKRGRPPKAKSDAEVKIPKKRGRPPKVKSDAKVKRQTVAERFLSQRKVKLSVPADSVITPTGPGKFTIHVDLNKRPVRKAPEVPKGVAPWRPIPKPRTVLPKERPVPKPRTKLPKERPVPKPRTRKPVSPPKVRKPVRVSREVKEQPIVVTPEEHEIDPFGTDLEKPFHRKIETAANGAAVTYSITPHYMDPLDQMTASRQVVRGILVNELKRMGGLKYTETIKVRMSKEIGDGKTKKDSVYFKSKTGTATNFEDIESTAAQNQLTILSRIETFQNLGSNWIILNIESHYVNIAMYKPLKGSSYMKLPGDISNPKCGLINMKNDDNMCFLWSHVRHLNPKVRRATTITQKDREFITNLDYKGIDFPVKISDIDKIERKNSISISVFGYKGKKQFYPIRNSKAKYEDHMELLLLGGGEGNNHYVLIKDVNRMLFSVSKHTHKKHFCLHCLHSCVSEESLENHKETCLEVNGTQAVNLPKEGTKIKFKNHRNSMPVPFVIYADFESILVPEERKVESENPEDKSSTDLYQTHKACSFGLKTVCHYDDKYSGEYKSYVGEDAALVFLKTVLKESFRCREMVNNIFKKKMVITPKQEFQFQTARNCSICGNDLGEDRVRDHDHVTGMYRGAAHNICNLKYRITWKVPVVFHNLRGYDSHLIMQEIGKFKMNVNVIPNNMEKYISFSLGKNLVFIDSIQFMASSLEALVSNLSPEDFRIVGKRWKGEDFNLVTQNGVFPYEFLDNISKLNTEGLPSKDKFYSSLYESDVKEEDYQRALKVWDHFKMKTMRDYHDLYLETDVLLLADVFENFRRTCLENYNKLDPAHYMSAPGLSWDAFLKQSGEEIELVSDMDMFQFFEKGMSILDLSKTLMYDFHYNTIKKEHGNNSRLLFTDTDSLMYELKTDDVYEDFKRIGEKQNCWDNSVTQKIPRTTQLTTRRL
ncbi:Gastrula zinc finger [Paramuricea clavata]|uniref:Gastrula zinc finger n=1 Tax=Paramuricea clavata TaxID=317549 RepID=A0A7D9J1J8_PARCT|nr:Gastrula zinc finger [Paramuricea clavata]